MLTLTFPAVDSSTLAASDVAAADLETTETAIAGTQVTDDEEGAASDDGFPIGFVIVTLVLILVAASAMIIGFRSTRKKKEAREDGEAQRQNRV